ncbi:hypothetical protein [Shewanella baltica]|uniref:hypothetical protein n=1 Tax=Shewanella baltica TaxID=62322 RepID=UPI0011C06EFB|nr:hypothetical protein [Shewanella baltica]
MTLRCTIKMEPLNRSQPFALTTAQHHSLRLKRHSVYQQFAVCENQIVTQATEQHNLDGLVNRLAVVLRPFRSQAGTPLAYQANWTSPVNGANY